MTLMLYRILLNLAKGKTPIQESAFYSLCISLFRFFFQFHLAIMSPDYSHHEQYILPIILEKSLKYGFFLNINSVE